MATSNLKIVSANCQGIRDMKKRIYVLKYIEDIGSEITCLQDTHWLSKDQKSIKNIWTGDCMLNGRRTNARGVAILIKNILSINFQIFIQMMQATLFLFY